MARTTQMTTINRIFGTRQVRTGLDLGVNLGIVRVADLMSFRLSKLRSLLGKRHLSHRPAEVSGLETIAMRLLGLRLQPVVLSPQYQGARNSGFRQVGQPRSERMRFECWCGFGTRDGRTIADCG